jgi:hypothetical protein
MNIYPYLLDILKYFIAGIGVVSATYYIIKPHLERSDKIQLLEFKRSLNSQTLPLRLQAYERLVLFIERVNPASMLIRLNASAYSASELHTMVVSEIREEYQHNVTQQIYVSAQAWGVMRRVKDDTLAIITNSIKALPEGATGMDLSRTVLMHLSKLEDNPYDIALAMIRKDLEDLF